MTATERITMVVLNEDGSRDKFTLSSWVGIPRKHELMWIGDDPYMIIEVEYAVSEGFFGARSTIDAAGVYVRRLTKDEQDAVARRLANPVRGKDEQPFPAIDRRASCANGTIAKATSNGQDFNDGVNFRVGCATTYQAAS